MVSKAKVNIYRKMFLGKWFSVQVYGFAQLFIFKRDKVLKIDNFVQTQKMGKRQIDIDRERKSERKQNVKVIH